MISPKGLGHLQRAPHKTRDLLDLPDREWSRPPPKRSPASSQARVSARASFAPGPALSLLSRGPWIVSEARLPVRSTCTRRARASFRTWNRTEVTDTPSL